MHRREGGKGVRVAPPKKEKKNKIRKETNLWARESRKPRVTSLSLLTLLAKQTWSRLTLQALHPGGVAEG